MTGVEPQVVPTAPQIMRHVGLLINDNRWPVLRYPRHGVLHESLLLKGNSEFDVTRIRHWLGTYWLLGLVLFATYSDDHGSDAYLSFRTLPGVNAKGSLNAESLDQCNYTH